MLNIALGEILLKVQVRSQLLELFNIIVFCFLVFFGTWLNRFSDICEEIREGMTLSQHVLRKHIFKDLR